MTIKIVDTYSGNQFNPVKLKASGISGVIFKAGQGEWPDVPRVHPEWWQMAKDNGLYRGWYWLADSRYHSSKHIEAMERNGIFNDNGELGLWIDVEKPMIAMNDLDYWMTKYAGYKNVVDILYNTVLNGVSPGIYTGPGAYSLVMRNAPQSAHEYMAKFDLWTAQYPYFYVEGISKPKLYGKWTDWLWWQWREGPDINNFNGTDAEFEYKYPSFENPRGNKMIFPDNTTYEEKL